MTKWIGFPFSLTAIAWSWQEIWIQSPVCLPRFSSPSPSKKFKGAAFGGEHYRDSVNSHSIGFQILKVITTWTFDILLKLMIRFENPTCTVAWQCRDCDNKKSAETENLCWSTGDGERMRIVCKGKSGLVGVELENPTIFLKSRNGHYSLYWKSTM